jgi:hypothetical protein
MFPRSDSSLSRSSNWLFSKRFRPKNLYPKHMNTRVLEAMSGRLEQCTNSDKLVGKAKRSYHPSSVHGQAVRKFLLILYFPSWLHPITSLPSAFSTLISFRNHHVTPWWTPYVCFPRVFLIFLPVVTGTTQFSVIFSLISFSMATRFKHSLF